MSYGTVPAYGGGIAEKWQNGHWIFQEITAGSRQETTVENILFGSRFND
ncbi:MAG TPA: hypothetical protein VM659_11665 [Dongiaceae bacterium]|nr:hypothetical protein [Dongiaceae bacterium]